MGAYVDASSRLRSSPLDCPVGASPVACPGRGAAGSGGYTYGDFGRILGSAEVHYDGEIWAQTLWDLRVALGSAKARALVTAGMRLLPPEPSFLDARNGILLADQALYAGADICGAVGRLRGARDGVLRRVDGRRGHGAGRELRSAAGARRPEGHDLRPRHVRLGWRAGRGRDDRARRRHGLLRHDRRRRALRDHRRARGHLPEGLRGRRGLGCGGLVPGGRGRGDDHASAPCCAATGRPRAAAPW